jgi:hypothetical protein
MEGEVITPSQTTETPVPAAVETHKESGITITKIGGKEVSPPPAATPAPQQPVAPAPATPVAGAPGTDGPGPHPEGVETTEVPAAPSEEEIDFFSYASEKTNGVLKDPDSVLNLYTENTELKKKLSEKPKIEFPNPGAEVAYNYAVKFPGKEKAAITGFYHVIGLGDVTKLSPKDAQFEAFALQHKNFSRTEAREYFEAKYEKSYGGDILQEDKLAQYDHRVETEKSIEVLSKLQEEFDKAQPSQPAGAPAAPVVSEADKAAIRAKAQEALGQFGGVRYQVYDNDPNSVVSIPMEDSEVQQLENWMSDPANFLNDLKEMCTENGQFSYEKLGMIMFEIKNRDRIKNSHFNQGAKWGELKKMKELKNTATPAVTQQGAAPGAPANFLDAFAAAKNGKKVGV